MKLSKDFVEGTIIIVNKEYADADDSDIIVNSMVIGRM